MMYVVQKAAGRVLAIFFRKEAAMNWVVGYAEQQGGQGETISYALLWVELNGVGMPQVVGTYYWWSRYHGHREWHMVADFEEPPSVVEGFVADLLSGDPVAVDALNDVLSGRKS